MWCHLEMDDYHYPSLFPLNGSPVFLVISPEERDNIRNNRYRVSSNSPTYYQQRQQQQQQHHQHHQHQHQHQHHHQYHHQYHQQHQHQHQHQHQQYQQQLLLQQTNNARGDMPMHISNCTHSTTDGLPWIIRNTSTHINTSRNTIPNTNINTNINTNTNTSTSTSINTNTNTNTNVNRILTTPKSNSNNLPISLLLVISPNPTDSSIDVAVPSNNTSTHTEYSNTANLLRCDEPTLDISVLNDLMKQIDGTFSDSCYETKMINYANRIDADLNEPALPKMSSYQLETNENTNESGNENENTSESKKENASENANEEITLANDLNTNNLMQQENMSDHLITMRTKKTAKKYRHTCPICPKHYADRKSLSRHVRTHDPKYRGCPYCGKKFSRKTYLDDHIRTHTGERPFDCSICHKFFRCKRNLKQHLKTHSDQRPFQCDQCSKMFKAQQSLTKHINKKHS